jgi:hypothetical protein
MLTRSSQNPTFLGATPSHRHKEKYLWRGIVAFAGPKDINLDYSDATNLRAVWFMRDV